MNKADIRWIARTFEDSVERKAYTNTGLILMDLVDLVSSYMRGQHKRMGNKAGFDKHSLDLAFNIEQIISHISTKESNEIWYPNLVSLGFADISNIRNLIEENLYSRSDISGISQGQCMSAVSNN